MIFKFYYHKRTFFYILIPIFLVVLFSGCDDNLDIQNYFESEAIEFIPDFDENQTISTRATLKTTALNYVNQIFYFQVKDASNNPYNQGIYWIASGTKGILTPKYSYSAVKWFSKDEIHYFSGWTTPWLDEISMSTKDDGPELEIPDIVPLKFKDTDVNERDNRHNWIDTQGWNNGYNLEYFVGTKDSGPYIYKEMGAYVPILFHHLVSKIRIAKFYVLDNATGLTLTDVRGLMTIYGHPEEVDFLPNGNESDVYPHVDASKYIYDRNKGIKFFIEPNWGTTYNDDQYIYLYVAPELDFTKLSFKIELFRYDEEKEKWILYENYGQQGAFYGDFTGVNFTRNGSSLYEDENGGDETVLHAGECITLSMSLTSKGSPSVSGTVSTKWNDMSEAYQYREPGIYTDQDASDFFSTHYSNNSTSNPQEDRDLYDVYGCGYTDDNPSDPNYDKHWGIIKLYTDITRSYNDLYLDENYIIDGMGHTIEVGTRTSIDLGHLRNVYIHSKKSATSNSPDEYEYLIYIDDKGYIWNVDPETLIKTPAMYEVTMGEDNSGNTIVESKQSWLDTRHQLRGFVYGQTPYPDIINQYRLDLTTGRVTTQWWSTTNNDFYYGD